MNPKVRNRRQQGNTVLEMLIALFVITTGLFAIIGLSFGNALQTKTSVNELKASNFAREGIEMVRNIRDSNKYKKLSGGSGSVPWNDGINTRGDFVLNNQNPQLPLDQQLVAANSSGGNRFIYQNGSSYIQGTTSTGTPTAFQRVVSIYPICFKGSAEDDIGSPTSTTCQFNSLTTGTGSTIGVQVTVTMRWSEGSRARTLTLEDRLYNW